MAAFHDRNTQKRVIDAMFDTKFDGWSYEEDGRRARVRQSGRLKKLNPVSGKLGDAQTDPLRPLVSVSFPAS
jgi:hypothetical protein